VPLNSVTPPELEPLLVEELELLLDEALELELLLDEELELLPVEELELEELLDEELELEVPLGLGF